MKESIKTSIKTSFKLLLAATTILAIAALFLVVSPQENTELVKHVNADIYSFSGIDEENNFRRAIEAMGIQPRPYDFNGNIMYFGNGSVSGSRSAEDLAFKVQEQLVASGVNSRNYLSDEKTSQDPVDAQLAMKKAVIDGEVIPYKQNNNFYQMTSLKGLGVLAEEVEGLTSEEIRNKYEIADYIHGYNYIDISQSDHSDNAEIIAVWTDKNFDPGKMINKKESKQSAPDPRIPSCIGCKRVRRVKALAKSEPYNMNKWVTTSTMDDTYDFYLDAMQRRGWKESGRQQMLNKYISYLPSLAHIQGRGLSLEKNGKTMSISILPNGGNGAEVFSLEKYEDTQPILDSLPIEPNSSVRDTIGNWFK